MKYHGSKL